MERTVRVNLAYLRLMRGKLSQRAIAEATGIGQKTLSALETGASKGIEFATLAKLCTFLNCSPSDLLLIEDEVDTTKPSPEALAKADEIIVSGLKSAMEAPVETAEELWAQFDAARLRIQNSAEIAARQRANRKPSAGA